MKIETKIFKPSEIVYLIYEIKQSNPMLKVTEKYMPCSFLAL